MAFDPEAGGSQSHVLTRSTFSKPVSFGGADCHGGPPPGVTRPARALGDAVEMPRAARSFSLVEWPPAHNRIVVCAGWSSGPRPGNGRRVGRWTLYREHVFADSSAIRDGGRWGDGDVPSAYSSSHCAHDRHESVRGTRTRSCLFPTKTIGILSSGSLAARQQRQSSDFESEGRGFGSKARSCPRSRWRG